MEKELTTSDTMDLEALSQEELEDLWKKKKSPSRSKFNTIVLDNNKLDEDGEQTNPGFGTLKAIKYVDDEAKVETLNVGFTFFSVFTRVQIVCRNYIAGQNGKQHPQYICKEVNQFEDIEVVEYATKQIVYTGPYKAAKEAYDLKYKVVIYAYYGETMYRWLIGGKDTLGSWFNVSNELNEATRPHSIKLKKVTPQNNGGIFWNDLEFELDTAFDIKKALQLSNALEEKFNKAATPVEVAPVEDLGEVVIDDVSL